MIAEDSGAAASEGTGSQRWLSSLCLAALSGPSVDHVAVGGRWGAVKIRQWGGARGTIRVASGVKKGAEHVTVAEAAKEADLEAGGIGRRRRRSGCFIRRGVCGLCSRGGASAGWVLRLVPGGGAGEQGK
ncbi:hypothetical protein GCM10020221_14530 [Streptomyces thioluteus]|uniref:Uncharacterized protein n=1 Tax=Streptomyces thioluteus TaxID=66431 RepID=A0ABN3WLW7_STRTU